jgi:hypothetical protein
MISKTLGVAVGSPYAMHHAVSRILMLMMLRI